MNQEFRIMRRRGRPRKSPEDKSLTRGTRSLRLTKEETKLLSEMALKCKMNFSEYCRKVLLEYHPAVPDSKFRDELIAARKDIVNFRNIISGMNMTKEEKKKFLQAIPTLAIWWSKLESMIEFLEQKIERI